MGVLADDVAMESVGAGVFRTSLSKDWEMWGPLGGYVAALALVAAGRESSFDRPVSFTCHYLSVAKFDDVDITVRARREGRSAASHHVSITQGDKAILDASVWSGAPGDGPEHHDAVMPDVVPAPPDGLDDIPEHRQAGFPFTRNFRAKRASLDGGPDADSPAASWQAWTEFQPVEQRFDDPWLDAARSVILLDVSGFVSATAMHGGVDLSYVAPSLDLNVAFHGDSREDSLLLIDTKSPVSAGGVFGWRGQTWAPDGRLIATGIGQSLWRKL